MFHYLDQLSLRSFWKQEITNDNNSSNMVPSESTFCAGFSNSSVFLDKTSPLILLWPAVWTLIATHNKIRHEFM